jgi:hypothetical protein
MLLVCKNVEIYLPLYMYEVMLTLQKQGQCGGIIDVWKKNRQLSVKVYDAIVYYETKKFVFVSGDPTTPKK